LPLHASAVDTPEGVIALLGPNSVGKSALAIALANAGATPVADDTLPLEAGTPPRAWPGLPNVRIREDVRAALDLPRDGLDTHEGKTVLAAMPNQHASPSPRPLAGIYLLAPNENLEREAAVLRTPFAPVLAAPAIVAHIRAGAMLGPSAVASMLQRVSPIVSLVPVHQLSVSRDLSRLNDAAREILSWYAVTP
jgi:hypothetical protein